jgi:hypothetical protein
MERKKCGQQGSHAAALNMQSHADNLLIFSIQVLLQMSLRYESMQHALKL